MFDMVGIGNPVYDTIITPFSRTDGRMLSGCSTNACLAAKRLGLPKIGLVGSIGPDYSQKFQSDMKKYGIEANVDTSSTETGGFHLIYDTKGDRTLDVLGIAGKVNARNLSEEFLQSRYFIVGPIMGEVDLELIRFLRSSTSGKIFLDPQGLIRLLGPDKRVIHRCDQEQFSQIVELVDFVKPNETESETITGQKDPIVALHRLQEMGAQVPIVTLAERGSLLLDGGTIHKIPAYSTKAIDPTGAGDTYAGSFITEYSRTRRLADSALFASAAASVKVEQIGPDFQMTPSTVENRRDSLRGLVTSTSSKKNGAQPTG
ncbi:MAG TPA: PfkB family carbohydrate kinase [Candidatus Acidoferrales bacterium]|nr:PfkB family carbohydrate kinase [Candidatus Acidoferrales bacterium]